MLFTGYKTFLIFLNIISVALGFNIYFLDEEVTTIDPNRDLTEEAIQVAMTIPGQGAVPDADIFHYENAQQAGINRQADRCYDDLNRCLLTVISVLRPVCAYNELRSNENAQCLYDYNLARCSKRTFRSICDLYLDNCRRGYTTSSRPTTSEGEEGITQRLRGFWRPLDYGRCDFIGYKVGNKWGWELFNVREP